MTQFWTDSENETRPYTNQRNLLIYLASRSDLLSWSPRGNKRSCFRGRNKLSITSPLPRPAEHRANGISWKRPPAREATRCASVTKDWGVPRLRWGRGRGQGGVAQGQWPPHPVSAIFDPVLVPARPKTPLPENTTHGSFNHLKRVLPSVR